MSHLENFKKTTSLTELAVLLGYKPNTLSYILYKIPNDNKYSEFTIPKKNGGERRIKAPIEKVKHLQRRLAKLLNQCFDEISKKNNLKRSLSHGFRKNHSIVGNARNHTNKRHVFNIDLQDFFPSINFGRVRGFFIKNSHFELNPKIATIVAQLACHDNELPQGSPCSPIISNLIGHLLDIRLANFAKKTKCTYSRYADDLTFSTNKKEFPEKIAVRINGNKWSASNALKKEIGKVGFTVNEKKTSLQYKTARQIATGLVINEKVNIKKEYYRQTRSMCNSLFQSNEFYLEKYLAESALPKVPEVSAPSTPTSSETPVILPPEEKGKGSIKQLEGMLSFIYFVKRPHDVKKPGGRKNHPTSITKLYRRFLFYKHFFSIKQPLILCEGKTDIIYLKCALRQLESEYQAFIEKTDKNFVLKVSFLNMTDQFKDVLAISGGASGLADIMEFYESYLKTCKAGEKKFPVIILVYNDSGSDKIIKKLKDHDPSKPFHYFLENLYIVCITKGSEREKMAIEDLFDKNTLDTKVDGKKFNRNPDIDSATEYGKIVFAEKVIRANENSINFDGFKEVLNRFKAVTQDYSKRITV